MPSEAPAKPATAQPTGKYWNLRLLYLQDVSFESPNAPTILYGHEKPELKFHVESTYRLRDKDTYEVVIWVNVHAVAGDKTMFLIEIKQGGVFEIVGHATDEIMTILKTRAPAALYPYVRELVASLISRGGFPRLQLRPTDFEAAYADALRERAAAAAAPRA